MARQIFYSVNRRARKDSEKDIRQVYWRPCLQDFVRGVPGVKYAPLAIEHLACRMPGLIRCTKEYEEGARIIVIMPWAVFVYCQIHQYPKQYFVFDYLVYAMDDVIGTLIPPGRRNTFYFLTRRHMEYIFNSRSVREGLSILDCAMNQYTKIESWYYSTQYCVLRKDKDSSPISLKQASICHCAMELAYAIWDLYAEDVRDPWNYKEIRKYISIPDDLRHPILLACPEYQRKNWWGDIEVTGITEIERHRVDRVCQRYITKNSIRDWILARRVCEDCSQDVLPSENWIVQEQETFESSKPMFFIFKFNYLLSNYCFICYQPLIFCFFSEEEELYDFDGIYED